MVVSTIKKLNIFFMINVLSRESGEAHAVAGRLAGEISCVKFSLLISPQDPPGKFAGVEH